jgi:hypothetical protein
MIRMRSKRLYILDPKLFRVAFVPLPNDSD